MCNGKVLNVNGWTIKEHFSYVNYLNSDMILAFQLPDMLGAINLSWYVSSEM